MQAIDQDVRPTLAIDFGNRKPGRWASRAAESRYRLSPVLRRGRVGLATVCGPAGIVTAARDPRRKFGPTLLRDQSRCNRIGIPPAGRSVTRSRGSGE